ncbi:hypothetical protein EDC04DRAFT_2887805 [Pisolithus marmoratus]|nr:hypothetical protein EDC04DRAFT_2887805 [Pisolithus marmoratus]
MTKRLVSSAIKDLEVTKSTPKSAEPPGSRSEDNSGLSSEEVETANGLQGNLTINTRASSEEEPEKPASPPI